MSLVLIALATYRITRLITKDVGPWHILERLRDRLPYESIRCPHCVGIYAAILAVVLHYAGDDTLLVLLVLAASGAVSVVHDSLEAIRYKEG